jgi:hypothetical protein
MIFAPLAAAALFVSVAIAPNAKPSLSRTLSMQQKSAAVQPLMRSATERIARIVSSDPRFGQPNADLGDLIVDSMPSCAVQVRIMIETYDRYFGEGEGEAFSMGPYLDLLPSAVNKWVRDSVSRATSAGLSTSESGSVSSTSAATTINAVGTPSASPNTP